MNLNRVDLIGRVVKKPELQGSGEDTKKFCPFTLAVTTYRDKNGEDHVDFIRCVIGGLASSTFAKYVDKGTKLRISGKLSVTKSTGKDGKNYENVTVRVSEFEFLSSVGTKEGGTTKSTTDTSKDEKKSDEMSQIADSGIEVSDDDLPF